MCFYSKQSKDALTVANRFRAKISEPEDFSSYDIQSAFNYPKSPVITNQNPSCISMLNWGLIPPHSTDESIRRYTLNARIETIEKTKSFVECSNNRCLVIADGFYEWKHITKGGKVFKEKYLISLPDNSLFAFAGLFSIWKDPLSGLVKKTYTIITTEADDFMAGIHNVKRRMPVILKEEDEEKWLNLSEINNFALPYHRELLAILCPSVNKKREDFNNLLF